MAKSSFWLRGAKGKLAGATIYDANGQSVMREVKAHIKNPRTKAQMIQRVISKTVMNQYAAMKAIVNHSFQGKTAGAKSMAYFASINNRATRGFVAEMQNAGIALSEIYSFTPCKAVKFMPARSIISEGTLPQIYATIANDGSKASVALQGVDNTYEAVINALGLQRGDQLTFVTTEKNSNGDYKFDFCRVILDPREADGATAPLSTAFIADGAIVKPSFRNEGEFAALTFADGSLGFSVSGGVVVTAGVIASRQVDNDWLRSTCELAFNETALGEDICSLEEAIYLSTAKTPVYTDSERYLNNAGVGGPQAGVSPIPENFGVQIDGDEQTITDSVITYESETIPDIILTNLPDGYDISVYSNGVFMGTMNYVTTGELYTWNFSTRATVELKCNDITFLTIASQ